MNEKEVNEYMDKVLSGEKAVEGLEVQAVEQFKKLSNELTQASQKLQAVEADAVNLREFILRTNGARGAYANLLVSAEAARRATKKEGLPTPTTLDDYRKSLGAKKVEAIDKEGNVLATAEEP